MVQRNFDQGYHDRFFYREKENSQRNQSRLGLIRSLQPGGKLLEVGCAPGGFLRLAAAYYDIEGIDRSRAAIQNLQADFGEKIRVANIDVHQLAGATYDVIAAFNILEHLRRPEKAVAKFAQALKPGGWVVGSVPYNASVVGKLVTRLSNYFDRTHVSTLPPDAWQRIFIHAGLDTSGWFGELQLGRNYCLYLRKPGWEKFAFNLIFIGRKSLASTQEPG